MFSQATLWHSCMAAGQLRTLSIFIVRSSASGSPHLENQRMALIRAGRSLGSNVRFETKPATACPAGAITGAFSIVVRSSDSSGVSRPRFAMSRGPENRSGIRSWPLDAPKNLQQICASALKFSTGLCRPTANETVEARSAGFPCDIRPLLNWRNAAWPGSFSLARGCSSAARSSASHDSHSSLGSLVLSRRLTIQTVRCVGWQRTESRSRGK